MNELVNRPPLLVFTTIEFVVSQGSCGTIQFVLEHSVMVTVDLALKCVPINLIDVLTIVLLGRTTMWGAAVRGVLAAAESMPPATSVTIARLTMAKRAIILPSVRVTLSPDVSTPEAPTSVTPLTSSTLGEFEERGEHELRGVPGTWRPFAVGG